MKIGIFLAYGPKTVLKKEGLGRYIANLIKGFQKSGHQVTIACPQWLIGAFDDLCEDYFISQEDITYIVSYKRPVLWDIHLWLTRSRSKKSRAKLLHTLGDLLEKVLEDAVAISSLLVFGFIVLLGAILALVLLPFALLLAAGYYIYKFTMRLFNKSKNEMRSLWSLVNIFFIRFTKTGKKMEEFLFDLLNKKVSIELVRKINKNPETIDIWFSPAAFWPVFNEIEGVKAVNLPDIVTQEFPILFSGVDGVVSSTQNVLQTVKETKNCIVYSQYIKDQIYKYKNRVEQTNVHVIPHSINDLLEYIQTDPMINKKLNTTKDFTTVLSRNCLRDLIVYTLPEAQPYLNLFSFSDCNYIFYASQIRPSKNVLNLVKAYHCLLRKRYKNVKLFLTGNYKLDDKVYEYIIENRLQFDVICFCGVSSQQLAALYRCADLVVNPTLYEGGFPFTFGEGMSVGTPSVMSRIPQVTEVTDGFELEEMLFDPYNWEDMAHCIEYGLDHRQELYEKQLPLYETLSARTQEVVAQEYIKAFSHFIDLDKAEVENKTV